MELMANFGLDVYCKCYNCGSMEFIENEVCYLYDTELNNPAVLTEDPAQKSRIKYQYVCAGCGEVLVRGKKKNNG